MSTKREEWTANDVGEVFDEIGAMVANARPEYARRIAAVPDYERALMRFYKTRGCGCAASVGRCSHCEAGDALRKGGVIK